ncbi:unnamed protein product [Lactuca virosa]|uniref:Zinc finger C3HC4 RING-type domain-containing protein n=1 Tax=Lactuca virosa TaxID=75947 RepID=A0AAU9LQV8_9ASTR|nr:unnamed protein product [Lactuca virosa]
MSDPNLEPCYYLHEIKSMTLLTSGTKGKQKTPTPPHRLISSVETGSVTFLERPKEDFTKKYGGGKVATTVGVIFPSILQLESGITYLEERKQKEIYSKRYSRKEGFDKGKLSDADVEREIEYRICMETNSRVVLLDCIHSLCFKCYRDWHQRSRSLVDQMEYLRPSDA